MTKSTQNALPELIDPDLGSTETLKATPSLASKIALLSGSILFTLVLLEVFVRIAFPVLAPKPWIDRPAWWYIPESSRDQRNALFLNAKPEGTFRIIVVGDSFTFAGKVQYDDNFAKRLERMLNLNTSQRKVEVLNWGIPGYSTSQEKALVKKAMNDYQADLVVLEITLNDPERQPYHASHAELYKWDNRVERWEIFHYWRTLKLIAQRLLNSIHTREYITYHNSLFSDPDSWNPFAKALAEMKGDSEEYHVPLVAMTFPMLSHPFDEQYPFAQAHQRIDERLRELGVPHLDLRPAFVGIPPERLQAMPGKDSHPNEIAHRIAAESLYTFLSQAALLPQDALIKNVRENGRRLPKAIVRGDKVGSDAS